MRPFWELAVSGFRRYSTYRAATLAGLFTNSVFGLLRAYVLLALLAARPGVGGYDVSDALSYVWLTQGLIMVTYIWGWDELAQRIVRGDVVIDLGRPVDLQGAWLASDLGRALYHALGRGIAPFIFGELFFRDLRFPVGLAGWLAFGASITLAVVVSFALRFITNLGAFWLLDVRGIVNVAGMFWTFLAGFVIPLSFLPDGPRQVVEALPFAAMIQIPIDVFLGKHQGPDLLAALAFQAAWALALLALGRLVLAAGVRRLVVQGG